MSDKRIERDQFGHVYGSNTGFTLPNGAVRSPDAAWVSEENYSLLTESDRQRFGHICPDFIIEIKSSSNSLKDLQAKMDDYMQNGSRLGYLVDPAQQVSFVYQREIPVKKVIGFSAALSGYDVLKGFQLPLSIFL